ncbi:hypothetical protein [Morganella morganii]|uniref:hypothetical protein n=1 Tax=Morganella morganii TaxID=582 RepID=UPI003138A891
MVIPINRANNADYEAIKGKKIASGQHRNVFEVKGHRNVVLKEEIFSDLKINETEYQVYQITSLNHPCAAKTIAKIYSISADGMYLIMEKLDTENINDGEAYNVMVEITDRKKSNFGKDSKGMIKCLDYSTLKITDDTADQGGIICITGNVVSESFPTKKCNEEYRDILSKLDSIYNEKI